MFTLWPWCLKTFKSLYVFVYTTFEFTATGAQKSGSFTTLWVVVCWLNAHPCRLLSQEHSGITNFVVIRHPYVIIVRPDSLDHTAAHYREHSMSHHRSHSEPHRGLNLVSLELLVDALPLHNSYGKVVHSNIFGCLVKLPPYSSMWILRVQCQHRGESL